MDIDATQLARQLIRALRGDATQEAFSRTLRCQSNVLYTWEAGLRFPSAGRFFDVVSAAGLAPSQCVARFLRTSPSWLERTALNQAEGVSEFLAELKGQRSIADLARATGKSRFAVARWLAGETQPRLPDLLTLIHASSYRLPDFVASLVDPARVPLLAKTWQQLEASRQAAYAAPWCHALLRLIETERFSAAQSDLSRMAGLLGLSHKQAEEALTLLEHSGQIVRDGQQLRVQSTDNVDLAQDPKALRTLKAWAARTGLSRIERGQPGTYSFNIFCVSERDYRRLEQLHRNYFRQLRAIIAESTPSERVVMTNLQLFALDGE